MKINFSGKPIVKPGHYADAWWDTIWRQLMRERGYSGNKITAFLRMTDTLIRLDLHEEGLWRGHNVK